MLATVAVLGSAAIIFNFLCRAASIGSRNVPFEVSTRSWCGEWARCETPTQLMIFLLTANLGGTGKGIGPGIFIVWIAGNEYRNDGIRNRSFRIKFAPAALPVRNNRSNCCR